MILLIFLSFRNRLKIIELDKLSYILYSIRLRDFLGSF